MNNLGNRASSDVLPGESSETSNGEIPKAERSPEGALSPAKAAVAVAAAGGGVGRSAEPEPPSGLKVKVFLVLLAILWLVVVAMTWVGEDGAEASEHEPDRAPASDNSANASSSSSDDEYNFNWLDPDKKIYVLQNRRYTKSGHALLSLMAGPGLSNPYRSSFNVDPRIAYYFTEDWGIEGFYTLTFNTPNNNVAALAESTATTIAVVHEIRSQGGALVHWAPWYAKINVFNKILYFDWYFTGGGGVVNWFPGGTGTQQAAGTVSSTGLGRGAVFAGTGQQFHLTESLTLRLDLTGAFFTAPIVGSTGDTAWYSNFNFGVGLGIRL